ncbi:MAG: HDOD domain-containing protein [Burkholderiaceae bacterium]|nr:HDOD domain-containing protein [Burkholderiaceae bacterium]
MSHVDLFFEPPLSLPAMPEVARRLLSSLGREDLSLDELAEIIASDAALAARLLRLANSARHAGGQRVLRLQDAAQRIGLGPLRGLALGASLADAFPQPPGFDRLRFWRQNLATAGQARWLAQRLGLDSDLADTGGLLLRSGQLLMLVREPGLLALIEALSGEPDSVFELERLHLGCSHAEVSAELAVRWRLPTALVDALHTAGDPLGALPFNPLGGVLRLASALADAGEDGLGTTAGDGLQQLSDSHGALIRALGLPAVAPGQGPVHGDLVGPALQLAD